MPERSPKPAGRNPQPQHRSRGRRAIKIPQISDNTRRLSDLFRAEHQPEDEPALKADIRDGTDRTACIMLTALLERNLERLLLIRIEMGLSIIASSRQMLFERDGPLATFYGNINFATALKLVTTESAKDLHIVRRIRNAFAHTVIPITFQSAEITKELARFSNPEYTHAAQMDLSQMTASRRRFTERCFQLIHEVLVMTELIDDYIETLNDAVKSYNSPVPRA